MSSQMPKLEKCPDHAELSLFCDGYPTKTDVAAHIAVCPQCAAVVEDYRRIARSIIAGIGEIPDLHMLNERIFTEIRVEQAMPPRFHQLFFNRISKVAAVLVVGVLTGVVGLHVGLQLWPGEESQLPHAPVHLPSSSGETAAGTPHKLPDLPYYTGLNFALRNGNSIPIQSLAAANYGDDTPIFSAAKGLAQPLVYTDIDKQVRQVWVIPARDQAATEIRDFLDRQSIVNSRLDRKDDGTLVLSALLDKEQLIKLVRFLDSRHFDLVSPAAPQPEQKYFLGSPNDMVSYSAEFVRE